MLHSPLRSRALLFATLTLPIVSAQPTRGAGGHPDLQGVWTNATLTPLERPASFKGKLNVSDAEAAVFERAQQNELASGDGKSDSDFHRARRLGRNRRL